MENKNIDMMELEDQTTGSEISESIEPSKREYVYKSTKIYHVRVNKNMEEMIEELAKERGKSKSNTIRLLVKMGHIQYMHNKEDGITSRNKARKARKEEDETRAAKRLAADKDNKRNAIILQLD